MEFEKAADRAGQLGAEPLVLLPGMMCDARIFTPQIEALSAYCPVIVAPLLGGDRIEAIAAHILTMLPERFALAGLSMGGIIAMEILRRAPGRVTRLCLMATTPLAETPAQAAEREPLIIGARTGRLGEMLEKALPAECLAPGPGRSEILNRVKQMGLTFGSDVFVDQNRALQRRMDQQAAARRCHVPTLILCGEYDRLTPVKRHELLASLIPQARMEVIGGAGHLPTLEQPDVVIRALKSWLTAPAEQQHPA
ncbi:alpha/beta fold hydrolase [Phycobacter sp. K97]|uniref:alpha/beta fold hydrolase n=1 Tax=Phycobacter sedimenti TaxID=3133977 RepID=UPI00311D74E6